MAAVVAAGLLADPAAAFQLVGAEVDLRAQFGPKGEDEAGPRPLFDQMVVADLTGDRVKEIVVPGSDGRLHILQMSLSGRRPELAAWTTVNTRVEGDSSVGNCYLTAAALEGGARESLVVGLPRGVFAVKFEGVPPRPEFHLFSTRTFFDPGEGRSQIRRLDFLADLDGDGTPEIWAPQMDGMAFWRRKADGSGWERVQTPEVPARTRQMLGARSVEEQPGGPAAYRLGFSRSLNFPMFELTDLDQNGRCELIVRRYESEGQKWIDRAECFPLADALHFTTAPSQVRSFPSGPGSQTFVDLNGDGWLDLLRVESNLDVVKPETVVEAFLSPPVREHRFARPEMGAGGANNRVGYRRYRTHDPIGIVLFGDWNRDGVADLAFSEFDYVFGSTDDLVDLILGREVNVTLRLVYGGPQGFPEGPQQDLKLRIRNRCFNYRMFPPLSMEGDYDGDGRADLLVRVRPDQCEIRLANGKDGQLSRRAAATFSMAAEGLCQIVDLDGDGRSDVVLCDPERPAVEVLLSRP